MVKNKPTVLNHLSDLLGDYQDFEAESYFLVKSSLPTQGITFGIVNLTLTESEIKYGNLTRTDLTFLELLQDKYHELEATLSPTRALRKNFNRPCLISDEVYELSFKSNQTVCPSVRVGTLANLKLRLSKDLKLKVNDNFISSLPEDFLALIKQNKCLEITIKLISPYSEVFRTKLETEFSLTNPQAYINKILNHDQLLRKFYSCTQMEKLPFNRFSLWGVSQPKFKNRQDLQSAVGALPLSDLGIKNIIHLRFVMENLDSVILTNSELLKLSFDSQLAMREHSYLRECILNNLPLVY